MRELDETTINDMPEKRLWFYALLDAIERFKAGSPDEERWIFYEKRNRVGSIVWVTDHLGIDLERLRLGLQKRWGSIDFFGRSISRLSRIL